MFITFKAVNGKKYALRPSQIRTLEGDEKQTKIWASNGGSPLSFTVERPFEAVLKEVQQGHDTEQEEIA